MVTTIPNKFTRDLLRRQSVARIANKLAQGTLANLKGRIYPHTLDIRAFTSCSVPSHLEHLLLSEDRASSVDLRRSLCRMHRAVGGSWTEYLKTDEELFRLASNHATQAGFPSIRTCAFCCVSHGTPRHYVMECPETEVYAVEICDAVEYELASLRRTQELVGAAKKHFLASHGGRIQCITFLWRRYF